jgi:hypothetical protein
MHVGGMMPAGSSGVRKQIPGNRSTIAFSKHGVEEVFAISGIIARGYILRANDGIDIARAHCKSVGGE